MAVCTVVRATYEWTQGNTILLDDRHGPRHRACAFIHDEIVGEAREDCAHEVSHEVARIMVDSMRIVTPDVAVRAEPCLMLRWDKNAKTVYEDGRLVPWTSNAVTA